MRIVMSVVTLVLMCACATSSDTGALAPQSDVSAFAPGELQVEIHSPSSDLLAVSDETSVDVQGVASTIGGVRFIDMMLVLDTSKSLRKTDPADFRSAGAVGLVENLSPQSDVQIGVVGFDGDSELAQALTSERRDVVRALRDLKRSGGTDLAAGILAAVDEFDANGRAGSSRVIMLFTDGKSNQNKAREATRSAQSKGIAIQTLLLGSSKKGASILEEIALGTGGSFVQVTDPSKLPDAFLNLRTTGVDNVTLSVNGSEPVPARLVGGTFTGNVPLKMGANRIVALATSLDHQTKQSTVTINVRNPSCAALEVSASNDGRRALSLNERAVEILVDSSRSMWGQIDGQPKMVVAKQMLQDVSDWLPENLNLALRAYGNSSPSDAHDCSDSLLLVPFGEENRQPIRDAISELRPLGQTPIAYALEQAAGDFSASQSDRAVVLVTDGIESCGGDPVAVARELRKQDIVVHLIGFGLDSEADEDVERLRAIAEAAGGRFITADSAEELKEALAVTVGTRFRVFKDARVVAHSALGAADPLLLPAGNYLVRLDSVPPVDVPISLVPREQLTLTMEKTAGEVTHSEQRYDLQYTSCGDAIAAMQRMEENRQLNLPISNTTIAGSQELAQP